MERTQANPSARIGADILANIYYARNNLTEPIRDVKLVIICQEEQLLRGILRTVRETNENKTLKSDECAVCLSNPPNVLFCNCGHLSICSGCFETIRQVKNQCVVCKEENATIRILS